MHVKSHSGHVYNELADHLAERARKANLKGDQIVVNNLSSVERLHVHDQTHLSERAFDEGGWSGGGAAAAGNGTGDLGHEMTDGVDGTGEPGGLGWDTDIQPDVSLPSKAKISHNPI
eukprot:11370183-Karenia_brevis.AAC.1